MNNIDKITLIASKVTDEETKNCVVIYNPQRKCNKCQRISPDGLIILDRWACVRCLMDFVFENCGETFPVEEDDEDENSLLR